MILGYVTGYIAYYDYQADSPRGCSGYPHISTISVHLQSDEVIIGFDVYHDLSYEKGLTMYTTLGSYGHYGISTGGFSEIRGYNLEYMFGRRASAWDQVGFHFTRC